MRFFLISFHNLPEVVCVSSAPRLMYGATHGARNSVLSIHVISHNAQLGVAIIRPVVEPTILKLFWGGVDSWGEFSNLIYLNRNKAWYNIQDFLTKSCHPAITSHRCSKLNNSSVVLKKSFASCGISPESRQLKALFKLAAGGKSKGGRIMRTRIVHLLDWLIRPLDTSPIRGVWSSVWKFTTSQNPCF